MIKITEQLEFEARDSDNNGRLDAIKFKLKTKSKIIIPLIMFALGILAGKVIFGA